MPCKIRIPVFTALLPPALQISFELKFLEEQVRSDWIPLKEKVF